MMKMKFKFLITALTCIAITANAQIPVYEDVANVIEAVTQADRASKASSEFVSLMFDVAAKDVQALVTYMDSTSAVVKASTPAKLCELHLLKDATANTYGWVVQIHTCKAR